MGGFDGLPDFGAPISGGPTALYRAYGLDTAPVVCVLPDQLTIPMGPGGLPDLRLSLTRPPVATDATPAWGAFHLRVAQHCPVEDALAVARAAVPTATVMSTQLAGGFARLVSATQAVPLPGDLSAAQPVDWRSVETMSFVLTPLQETSFGLLKGALLGNALAVWARVEVDVPGVARRVPASVTFAPKALLATVLPAGPAPRAIGWADLVAGLSRGPLLLPLTLDPPGTVGGPELGEALADRICATWGQLTPSAAGDTATIAFPDDAKLPDQVRWDLSLPTGTRRPVALQLDPIAEVRTLVASGADLTALVKENTATRLPTGVWEITVAANLPPVREGVVSLGATLRAPAHPPARFQEVIETVDLPAPASEGTLRVQLGPKEALAYTVAPYAVLLVDRMTRRLEATAQPRTGTFLELEQADFPVTFLPVSAAASLLAMASLTGTLSYDAPGGKPATIPFVLTASRPSTSVPLPNDATQGSITVIATPTDGGPSLTLGPLPAAPLSLGPWSFRQFGPQHVTLEVVFPAGIDTYAIDLMAEGAFAGPDTITTLAFTPATPRASWGYVASSPFHGGFRHRRFVSSGPLAPWSEVHMPNDPLSLQAEAAPTETPATPAGFDVDGVHFYVDPTLPATLRYVPAAPSPVRGPDGRPMMTLFDLGAAGSVLQLSVRFDLDDALRDRLPVDLSAEHLALAASTLQPAPLSVDLVTVRLARADGATVDVLGTSQSSRMPPWNAIFSLKLDAAQAAQASRALAGQTGILSVTVHARLMPEVSATFADASITTLERTADVASWVASVTAPPATPTST